MDLKGENNMFKKNGIELGKVLERDNIPYVKGTDKRVSWQTESPFLPEEPLKLSA